MKKLLHFIFVAMMVAACSQDVIVEVQNPTADLTRTINVSLEGEDTRIQLNDELKTVWTKDDLVSVFYRSTVNEQWQFQGETGDRSGDIMPVDSSINPPATTNHIVVVYPYNEGYFYNSETRNVQASLPAEQTYLKDSYGLNGNIMISSSEYNQISLKSVCGWLKLQLTGSGEKVQSITLRGNDDEQVAGELYINSSDASSTLASTSNDEVADGEAGGTLVHPGTILKEVTLNCGDGVELGTEPTAFYIALPPQTFATGLTIDIECDGYTPYSISTDKAIIIERNTIQPMATVEFEGEQEQSNNEIWYTATAKVEPYNTKAFGANITSNVWDKTTGKGVITFDGEITSIGDDAFISNMFKLQSIIIPKSVRSIGSNAFYFCSSLTSVTIPESVKYIYDSAFQCCSKLQDLTIPDSVTSIGEFAFADCDNLTSITIGKNVKYIYKGSFERCKNLTTITIPESVVHIGVYVFSGCTKLSEFNGKFASSDRRCLIDDKTLIAYAEGSGTTYTIPDYVTTIGDFAFYECNNLTSITINNAVTTIGAYAFAYNQNLTNVIIGNHVSTIKEGTFYECNNLTTIYSNNSTPPTLDWRSIVGINAYNKIYVPASEDDSIINAYKSAKYWSDYASHIYEYDYTNE